MTEQTHTELEDHLLRHIRHGERQEDVCFALWTTSVGDSRTTALIKEVVMPERDERILQGDVAFTAEYYKRVLRLARRDGCGVAALHNHFVSGWQGMSSNDEKTERLRAPSALEWTGFPLLGMTLGTDGSWSGRFWLRTVPKRYEPFWCTGVRVVGQRLRQTFHPKLKPPPSSRDELVRTINVWGSQVHADLARIHVGIVGLGSVGRMVAEGLARMGVERVTFIDFDHVKRHNLDRLLGAYPIDAKQSRLKVHVAEKGFLDAAISLKPEVNVYPDSVAESAGFRAALNCDVLFSCVDRPWARHVLNYVAYAHLIPVVDGGIIVRFKNNRFRGVEWSLRTAGPTRACLQCAGAYDPSAVNLERQGLLDDPSYIQGLDPDHPLRHSENTFPFSMSLAAHETLQFIGLVTNLLGHPDFGDQRYHYNTGKMVASQKDCVDDCYFPSLTATGEIQLPEEAITGDHSLVKTTRDAAERRS